jgi:hypothetical protein
MPAPVKIPDAAQAPFRMTGAELRGRIRYHPYAALTWDTKRSSLLWSIAAIATIFFLALTGFLVRIL